MVNTLSGSVSAYRKENVKPRFIRIDEASNMRMSHIILKLMMWQYSHSVMQQ